MTTIINDARLDDCENITHVMRAKIEGMKVKMKHKQLKQKLLKMVRIFKITFRVLVNFVN